MPSRGMRGQGTALRRVRPCDLRGGLDGLQNCFGGSLATSSNGEFSCDSQTLWAAQAPRPMSLRPNMMRAAHHSASYLKNRWSNGWEYRAVIRSFFISAWSGLIRKFRRSGTRTLGTSRSRLLSDRSQSSPIDFVTAKLVRQSELNFFTFTRSTVRAADD